LQRIRIVVKNVWWNGSKDLGSTDGFGEEGMLKADGMKEQIQAYKRNIVNQEEIDRYR